MQALSIVGIAGSVRQPSRTTSLVAAVLDAIGDQVGYRGQLIELADGDTTFFDALSRDAMNERARATIAAIEGADILVVGTPVYRASYTGLFKHMFDLVHCDLHHRGRFRPVRADVSHGA